ncbi:hypothetical protein [Cellulosimicrobium sp. Marseille-Q4280]|uniref:hypothetical protein n=1 Tax=Cellulosimicrobium sp. Marseille-Q4280 TaxID=2937992 RepID=UPI002041AAB0|nr:hypothetical protein [Cellulosimicrobium sp. Marseille-Q4280]
MILTAGIVLAIVALVLGLPGALLAVAGAFTAAFFTPPVMFTGKKDRAGRPTAAHQGESDSARRYRRMRDLRWRVLTPNADWLPGKDVRVSWVIGLLAAVALAAVGLPRLPLDWWWAPVVNGVLAALAIWQVTGSGRRFASDYDPHPGIGITSLVRVKDLEKKMVPAALAATAAAVIVAAVGSWVEWSSGYVPAGAFGSASSFVAVGALTALAGLGTLTAFVRPLITAEWSELVATRLAWDQRWLNVGVKDDAPFLVEHRRVGPVAVDTFDAPASSGAMTFTQASTAAKITVALGANMRVWTKSEPNIDGQGQPVPGSVHPLRFSVVYVPGDQMPNVTDVNLDEAAAQLIIEAAMGPACDMGGVSRYSLAAIEQIAQLSPSEPAPSDDEDGEGEPPVAGSPWRIWRTVWANGDGLGGTWLRNAVKDYFAMQLSDGSVPVQVLVDHRAANGQGIVYIGYMTEAETVYDPASGVSTQDMVNIEREDAWRGRWSDVLKQGTNAPTPELSLFREESLSGARGRRGTVVHSQPFVTLQGDEPRGYFGLEDKIKATLAGAPFVAVTGYPGRGERPGERHSQAFCVYWSEQPVPDGPHSLTPTTSDAAQWVLAGRINEAFKAARLARPEVAAAKPLTKPTSNGHIWRIDLRLYDGVTLAEVRAKRQQLRGALGSAWLRVVEAADGCTIYAGADPAKVTLAREADRALLVSLDWEQAWLVSKVTGEGGTLPRLTGVDQLPHNTKVQVLDFALPAGLSPSEVRAGIEKLKTATGNAFAEVQPGVDGASSVRLLVCEVNPLPEKAPYDFAVVDKSQGKLVFATGVDGEPIAFNPRIDPHLLVAGASGGGKDQALDARFPVPVSERFPGGWARNGELVEGDQVFAADGTATTVVGFSDVVVRDTYRLHLSDGQVVESGPEHLWKVATAGARAAHSGSRGKVHQASVAELTRRAQEMRALVAEVGVGTSAPLSDIARLAGYSELALHGMDLPIRHLADVVALPSNKKAAVYDMGPVADYLGATAQKAHGQTTFAGRVVTGEVVQSLRERGWLSARSMSDHLVGGASTRSERDLAKQILRRLRPEQREGTTTFATNVYPVDEVLTLLAERLEARATGSEQDLETLVTAQEMYDQQRYVSSDGGREAANYAIRLADAIDMPEADLPVDPYVLGAWLGDGNSRGGQICAGFSAACTDADGVTDQEWMRRQLERHHTGVHAIASSPFVLAVPGLYRDLRVAGVLGDKHIPATYLRASRSQRLALLQGLMDTDGTVATDGGCELSLCNPALFTDAVELIRSLGIKASTSADPATITEDDPDAPGSKRRRVTGTRYRVRFTTDQVVFRLPRKAARLPEPGAVRETQRWVYVEKVTVGEAAPMRCIKVAHPKHLYLTDGFIPTHNSVTLQSLIYGSIINGWDLFVADPTKGAADFQFAAPYAKAVAVDPISAAAMMRAIYAEVVRRKDLNAKYKVGNYRDLPEEVRPNHILLVIDEFTSLMGTDPVPAASDDAEMDAEREAILASNRAKTEVGVFAGKIAREARSAGVTLVLATQKLAAKLLDTIPGAGDLKVNLSRMLLGKATFGDKQSALRDPTNAPGLGDAIPPGRGLWETTEGQAKIMQSWYDPREQAVLSERLAERVATGQVRELTEEERLDLASIVSAAKARSGGGGGPKSSGPRVRTITAEEVELDEMVMTWDDLDGLDLGGPEEQPEPQPVAAEPSGDDEQDDDVDEVEDDDLDEDGDGGEDEDDDWPNEVRDIMRELTDPAPVAFDDPFDEPVVVQPEPVAEPVVPAAPEPAAVATPSPVAPPAPAPAPAAPRLTGWDLPPRPARTPQPIPAAAPATAALPFTVPAPAPAPVPAPVAPPAAAAPSDVLLLDVDGVISALTPAPDAREVPGPGGTMHVSPRLTAAITALGVPTAWATNRSATETGDLAAATGLTAGPGLDPADGTGDLGWWKVEALATWLVRHPGVTRLAWVDDELASEDIIGIPFRDTAADILNRAGVQHLLLSPAPEHGLTSQDLAALAAFFGVDAPVLAEPAPAPAQVPAPQAAPVAQPEPEPAPVPAPVAPAKATRAAAFIPAEYADDSF